MKHSPGQGSLHRGKFHPDEEHSTKTPAGFRRMLSAQPTLRFSSSDTQKVFSPERTLGGCLEFIFREQMLKGKCISITVVGLTPAPEVFSPLSGQTQTERPAHSSRTDQDCIFSAVTQNKTQTSIPVVVVYTFSFPLKRAGRSYPNIWVIVGPAESSVFAAFIFLCKGPC